MKKNTSVLQYIDLWHRMYLMLEQHLLGQSTRLLQEVQHLFPGAPEQMIR